MQFIHAADAHIDSPLRGLELYPGAPVELIRQATRQAFANLVSMAIERRVAFVVLAGDLFDGPWPDMQTGIWTAAQFRRLAAEEIPVYLLRGNHDAVSEVQQSIRWPDNVYEFSCDRPQTYVDANTGVALHGQGFSRRDVTVDLAAHYPPPVPHCFNIGVLHTSLTGDPQHDTYAPTSLAQLRQRGYQYWALGHIHQRSEPTLCTDPMILYSGNLQGRHIREPGPKGCCLVTVEGQRVEHVEFLATDTVRWFPLVVRAEQDDCLPEIHARIRAAWGQCRTQAQGRLAAIRLRIEGPCRAHAELQHPGQREAAIAQIRDWSHATEGIWTEKIELDLRPTWDLAELRAGNDVVAELLQQLHDVQNSLDSHHPLWHGLQELGKHQALELQEAGIDLGDLESRRRWLQQAETYLATSLMEQPE